MKKWFKIVILITILSFGGLLYADQTTHGEDQSDNQGDGGTIFHLVKGDPAVYRATIYKIYIVADDGTEVTLYENESGNTVDMTIDEFSSLTSASVSVGTYTQAKIITSSTFGLKGYVGYPKDEEGEHQYYTKDGTNQEDIGRLAGTSWTSPSGYGTQTATMTDPGTGTEETTYNGNPAFIYTSTISLTVDENTTGTLRVRFLTDKALELNDDTINTKDHPNSNPAGPYIVNSITFSAPQVDVQIL